MRNEEEKTFSKVVVIAAIVITIVALYFLMLAGPATKVSSSDRSTGKPQVGGEFTLTDFNGNPFGSNELKGKPSLIYFGFTFCPDICPTALQKLTSVLDDLAKLRLEITPVFITVDPKRDTGALLKQYLGHFHPKFIGLTGSDIEIKKVADEFKVFYEIIPGSDTGHNDYLLDHSSLVYIMDKNGEYVGHFHIDLSSEEMVEYIRKYVK